MAPCKPVSLHPHNLVFKRHSSGIPNALPLVFDNTTEQIEEVGLTACTIPKGRAYPDTPADFRYCRRLPVSLMMTPTFR